LGNFERCATGTVVFPQIIKILNLYTPAKDYEEKIPLSFVHMVQARLKERAKARGLESQLEQVSSGCAVYFSLCL